MCDLVFIFVLQFGKWTFSTLILLPASLASLICNQTDKCLNMLKKCCVVVYCIENSGMELFIWEYNLHFLPKWHISCLVFNEYWMHVLVIFKITKIYFLIYRFSLFLLSILLNLILFYGLLCTLWIYFRMIIISILLWFEPEDPAIFLVFRIHAMIFLFKIH